MVLEEEEMQEIRLKNLKKGQFKKGENGKQRGRVVISALIRKYLQKDFTVIDPDTEKRKKKKAAQIMVEAMGKRAMAGDLNAFNMFMDRTEGPVTQQVAINTDAEAVDMIKEKMLIKQLADQEAKKQKV